MYVVQIVYDGKVQASELYRTLPDETTTRDIIFISGGDAGINSISESLSLQTAKYDPDVVVIGGDLAYDNNLCACYFTWDYFLNEFKMLDQTVGRLVPLLFSVGNHDVGMNTMINQTLSISNEGPAYFMYFPQSTIVSNGALQVPPIDQRPSYHYHTFGKVLHWNIDSGYLSPYVGDQLDFMNTITDAYPNYAKFAAYHNPTYYSCGGG
jgi:hypothetical protein